MKQLIITADDYGMSKAVNRGIDAGIEAGLITATNVMTNMDFFKEAARLIKTNASVGVHWTLTCGFPVLPPKEIPSLVMQDGQFYDYPEFRNRYRQGLISDSDIENELVAQYKRYVDLLDEPEYWSTHQNVHVAFKLYPLFVSLALKLNIKKMRSHERIYVPASGSDSPFPLRWRILEPIKVNILHRWQKKAHRRGVASPDGLIVCLNTSDENKPEYVFSHIVWKNSQIGELIIHPATECDSPYFGGLIEQRIKEYELFSSRDTLMEAENCGIRLVNYSAIK